MSCCDMNARGDHCDCNPCGICEDKAEAKRQQQQRAQVWAWAWAIVFGIAVTVSAVFLLGGCRLDVYHVPPLPPRQDAGPGIIVGTGDLDAGEETDT